MPKTLTIQIAFFPPLAVRLTTGTTFSRNVAAFSAGATELFIADQTRPAPNNPVADTTALPRDAAGKLLSDFRIHLIVSALPLRWLLPWPEALLGPSGTSAILDQVMVSDLRVNSVAGGWTVRANVLVADPNGVVLALPGWDEFALVLRELSSIEVALVNAKLQVQLQLGALGIRLPRFFNEYATQVAFPMPTSREIGSLKLALWKSQ